jgi:hypothetical protein
MLRACLRPEPTGEALAVTVLESKRRMILQDVEARLCAGSSLALAAGVLYYTSARGADPLVPVLGAWGGSLPTLLHGAAFTLLALAVSAPWPRLAVWICAGWLSVEVGFELLQADAVAHAIETGLPFPAPAWLRTYLDGTFDPLDVLAALTGVLAAFGIATRTAAGAAEGAR